MQELPPTNDPALPSYLCPEWVAQVDDWDLCRDMQTGRGAWYHPLRGVINSGKAQAYLPKEYKEPTESYLGRLARSHFDNRYGPALSGFAGLLSFFSCNDLIPSIEGAKNNIDRMGSDLQTFLMKSDALALRDGWCAILVDRPKMPIDDQGNPLVTNALTEQALSNDRRPYLSLIESRDCLNWSVEFDAKGELVIQWITIRECHKDPDGYGSKITTRYRVLRPGSYQVFEIVKSGKDWNTILVEEGQTSLDYVPLVCYSISGTAPFCEPPPLKDLASLNLKLYQQQSDADEIRHKLNLPTPVRIGVGAPYPGGPAADLQLGPNSFVDLPVGGDFKWAVPDGSACEQNRLAINDLKADIDRYTLEFFGGDQAEKTAKQVTRESVRTKASLESMARIKQSNVEITLRFWANYLSQESGGSIEVSKDLLREPITPEQITAVYAAGLISRETALVKLAETGMIDDPEAELARLEAELDRDTQGPTPIPGAE